MPFRSEKQRKLRDKDQSTDESNRARRVSELPWEELSPTASCAAPNPTAQAQEVKTLR